MQPTLSQIHIYPLKSGAPLTLVAADVQTRGLAGDRRWMVTDLQGKLLSARQHPRMTLIRARIEDRCLQLSAPGMAALTLDPDATHARFVIEVWGDRVDARAASAEADAWISAYLGLGAHIAHMDAAALRPVDADYGRANDEVSFADGFPLLLISQAALDALNTKLAQRVPMLRFRPNLVVANTAAHAEDGWRRIRVGVVEFDVVKACARCVLTTVDFERGEFDPAGEPLRTLITYRRTPKGVTFGQNLIPRGQGVVRVGDAVEILE
jgi:uncharacterized protein YcbX